MRLETINLTYGGPSEDLDTLLPVMTDYENENKGLVVPVKASVFEEVRKFIFYFKLC